jgi:hypothetical protein
MAVTKQYDEMADRYTYQGERYLVINNKNGFGIVTVSPAYVDLKDGGDCFWIIFTRKANNWYWIERNGFIILADGQRFTGMADVVETDVTQEMGWFDTLIKCNEEMHCGASPEIMEIIGQAQSVKIRLGDVDMDLPSGFISDVRDIVSDINATGGYGDI